MARRRVWPVRRRQAVWYLPSSGAALPPTVPLPVLSSHRRLWFGKRGRVSFVPSESTTALGWLSSRRVRALYSRRKRVFESAWQPPSVPASPTYVPDLRRRRRVQPIARRGRRFEVAPIVVAPAPPVVPPQVLQARRVRVWVSRRRQPFAVPAVRGYTPEMLQKAPVRWASIRHVRVYSAPAAAPPPPTAPVWVPEQLRSRRRTSFVRRGRVVRVSPVIVAVAPVSAVPAVVRARVRWSVPKRRGAIRATPIVRPVLVLPQWLRSRVKPARIRRGRIVAVNLAPASTAVPLGSILVSADALAPALLAVESTSSSLSVQQSSEEPPFTVS